jgi:hypothetical protein
MRLSETARRLIADPYAPSSLAGRSRQRRWELLLTHFPGLAEMDVVDLGGVVASWANAPVRPRTVTLVNLFAQEGAEGMDTVVADACALDGALGTRRFDLVVSNSVIDEVGGHHRRLAFAATVHRLGSRHWVQAPNRYFPLDPRWLFPAFPQLPLDTQVAITQRWPVGHRHTPDRAAALAQVQSVEMLSRTALAGYFPASEILVERAAGMPKSLIAVRV